MARALIVGCGCRGRALGERLREQGWAVRGTSRDRDGAAAIGAAGIEAVIADPDQPATLLDLVADVAVVAWVLGSASGPSDLVERIHGPRLEGLLAKLVDTPVRGLVYEGAGSVPGERLERGAEIVRQAADRWRIRAEVVDTDPSDPGTWLDAMLAATSRVLAGSA
jgi:nucleoside-diphosphate-sugar epimerase